MSGERGAERAARLYEILLRLYPRPFRERYGPRMRRAFAADRRRWRCRRFGGARFWLRVVVDTVHSAVAVRYEQATGGPGAGRTVPSSLSRGIPDGPVPGGGRGPEAGDGARVRGTAGRLADEIRRDVRHGVRALRTAPGFTVVAVAILALGTGATTTVFTLTEALLFRSPPGLAEPERLVRISRVNDEVRNGEFPYHDYVDLRDRNETFAGIAAYNGDPVAYTVSGGAGRWQLSGAEVSGNYFDVLGVRMAVGRGFLPGEDRTVGTHPVLVLSHAFWTQQLGGDPAVVGTTLRLNGHPFTVVGVAPAGFGGVSFAERPPDLWVPLHMRPLLSPSSMDRFARVDNALVRWLRLVGRLAPGVERRAAEANLVAIAEALEREHPEKNEGESVALTPSLGYSIPLEELLLSTASMLGLVVAAVLLVAAANIAVLLMARGAERREEIAIRAALGAGRGRIVRQLMVESLLLSAAGAAAGLLMATWATGLVASMLPFPTWAPFTPDPSVFAFTAALALLTALLFGTLPALRSSAATLPEDGGGRVTRRSWLRDTLVVAQVAVSLVLVVAAGLFVRSLATAESVDLGFEIDDRLVVSVNFGAQGYELDEARRATLTIMERLEGLPQVERVTLTRMLPFSGTWGSSFEVPGVEPPEGGRFASYLNAVGPGYFATMEQAVLRGRDFGPGDAADAPRALIVNRTAARRIWGTEEVVGRTIEFERERRGDETVPWTVVGVVRDAAYYRLGEEPRSVVYLAALQYFDDQVSFLMKTRDDPMRVVRDVQAEFHGFDPDLPFAEIRTLEQAFETQVGTYRSSATLVTAFGGLAVALALVGLYGVLAYVVARRSRELGIRLALGATAPRLAWRVVRRGVGLAAVGALIGLGVAWAGAELVASFLYEVTPRDPLTFLVVPVGFLVAAALASLVPARRAAAVDPMVALRQD